MAYRCHCRGEARARKSGVLQQREDRRESNLRSGTAPVEWNRTAAPAHHCTLAPQPADDEYIRQLDVGRGAPDVVVARRAPLLRCAIGMLAGSVRIALRSRRRKVRGRAASTRPGRTPGPPRSAGRRHSGRPGRGAMRAGWAATPAAVVMPVADRTAASAPAGTCSARASARREAAPRCCTRRASSASAPVSRS